MLNTQKVRSFKVLFLEDLEELEIKLVPSHTTQTSWKALLHENENATLFVPVVLLHISHVTVYANLKPFDQRGIVYRPSTVVKSCCSSVEETVRNPRAK